MKKTVAIGVAMLALWCPNSCVKASIAEAVAAQIRAEAIRSNSDPAGQPLPLASHWTTGSHQLSAG